MTERRVDMKFSNAVVKHRALILIMAVILMVPAVIGMTNTRINYDMLDYLPSDMDTVKGQNELLSDFGKGAFSFLVIEDMSEKDVSELKFKIEQVEHVETALWYDSIFDLSVPMEILPDEIYSAFNSENSTMIAVFFDTSTSDDATMDAIREIRKLADKQCFVSGMSAMVTDMKDLCEREEPIYVAIAVVLSTVAMLLLLDNWLIPFVFLTSIGMMILLNLGTNIVFGEISYITKALSAVLQLAVTMDYSIFLWHSYHEQLNKSQSKETAMAIAIHETLASVIGSSVTTVAGFIALCFMSFTLGKDLGIVMAKGVILGVIGCVTVLPSLILVFDKVLTKTQHKSLIPDMNKLSGVIIKIFPISLVIFAIAVAPAYYGYYKTDKEVYYNIGESLPEDMAFVIANSKLSENFNIASTHMILTDSNTSPKAVRSMIDEMEQVNGVKYVLGLESVVGSLVPEEIIPESVTEILKSDKWELLLINSEYGVATDEVNAQLDSLNKILKSYDNNGLLIGEAPCTKDMIETTAHDFKVVNAVSILAIFFIIMFVERSLSLPCILIAVIELAIFINLGLPHYMGQSLPFIAPICISTIQLGATVDYAILMTTRYKSERMSGLNKKDAVHTALSASIPSILVSGMGLFAATFGVAVYSDIDMISSMCMLMARGAVISMILVTVMLPAWLMLCDKFICATTIGMKKNKYHHKFKEAFSHE